MNRLGDIQQGQLQSAFGSILLHAIETDDEYLLNRISYVTEKLYGKKAIGSLTDWLIQCGEREASQ